MDTLKVNIPDNDRKILEYKKALAERDAMMHSANELDKQLYNYINEILKHRSHPSTLGIVNLVFWLIVTIASLIWFIVGEPVAIYFFIIFLVSYITGILWYAYSMSQRKRKYKNFNAMHFKWYIGKVTNIDNSTENGTDGQGPIYYKVDDLFSARHLLYRSYSDRLKNGAPAIIVKIGQTDYIGSLRNWFKQEK